MKWIIISAVAKTPIAIPSRSQAGNIYESSNEISGSAVRGAFAAKYICEQNWYDKIPVDHLDNFKNIFENSNIRFGPLRPLPSNAFDDEHAFISPMPRSARGCKYDAGIDKHGILDNLILLTKALDRTKDDNFTPSKCSNCQAPIEPIGNPWLYAKWDSSYQSGNGIDFETPIYTNTHVGMQAVSAGTNLAEEGRLFSLQHFPAGTRFQGWIAIDGDLNFISDELSFHTTNAAQQEPYRLRVGRRSKSYGALDITASISNNAPWENSYKSLETRFKHFQQIKNQMSSQYQNCHFIGLTCITDTILIDDFLRHYRTITEKHLTDMLMIDLALVHKLAELSSTSVIRGWNSAHKMPKENDAAISTGSVFLFAIDKKIDEQSLLLKLSKFEEHGIGWRKSEGFGQLLVCDPWHVVQNSPDKNDGKISLSTFESKNDIDEYDSLNINQLEIHKFVEENEKFLCDLSKTQLNSLRDRASSYNSLPNKDHQNLKILLKQFIINTASKGKPDQQWNANVGDKTLSDSLITLFALNDNSTTWHECYNRVLTLTHATNVRRNMSNGFSNLSSSEDENKSKSGESIKT